MRTPYDFGSLSRSSVGFDRLFDLINQSAQLRSIRNIGSCCGVSKYCPAEDPAAEGHPYNKIEYPLLAAARWLRQ